MNEPFALTVQIEQESGLARNFCQMPPAEYLNLFQSIGSTYQDEIDAHMNIFDSANREYYDTMLAITVSAILNSLV